jgi:ankyrin repeat protein
MYTRHKNIYPASFDLFSNAFPFLMHSSLWHMARLALACLAATHRHSLTIRFLVRRRAASPLMAAASYGHLEVVQWLHQEGADLYARNRVSQILVFGMWRPFS